MKKLIKKIIRRILFLLVLALCAWAFLTCSFFGTVKRSFEDHGYTLENESGRKGTFIQGEETISYTVYTFQKEADPAPNNTHVNAAPTPVLANESIVVWEFDSKEDLKKALKSIPEVTALFKDTDSGDYTKGSCLLMTKSDEAVKIFNGEK